MGLKASPEQVRDLPAGVVEALRGLGVFPVETGYEDLPELNRDNPAFVYVEGRSGEDQATHEGLMDMAHRDGLALVYTEPIQIPPKQARQEQYEPIVFRAIVATRRGVFSAFGDAHERDTEVDAVIRMAETRAMNRALRSAVNHAAATYEEMPDADVVVE